MDVPHWAARADRGGDAAAASAKGGQRDDVPDALDFVSERPQSLAAYVLEQIELLFADPADRRIALKLAEGLDEAGYCRLDASAVADGIHVDVASVERVWAKLRQIEPSGLFARTVSECLAAQLAERDRLDPAMKALLENLDLVAAGELGQLRRRCGVDDEDLHDMLAELRTLDPRPGQKFDFEPIQPVAPDLYLTPAKDPESGEEGWHIELNTDALPKVLVDRNYHATLMKGARAKPDRDFVAERFQSANWLVKTLEQRATTILKVAREIVKQQDGFFRHGVSALKPLVLRDIAIATELHESTVSRVTSNKYIATPRGIFELKYFFNSSINKTDGDNLASEAVKNKIGIRTIYDLSATPFFLKGSGYPEGTLFPVKAFDQFGKQGIPRWATNDAATQAAYDQYVQKVCPCVIVVHSQGGNFGFTAALTAPDKIKALVLVEPSGAPPATADAARVRGVPPTRTASAGLLPLGWSSE